MYYVKYIEKTIRSGFLKYTKNIPSQRKTEQNFMPCAWMYLHFSGLSKLECYVATSVQYTVYIYGSW